MDDLYGSDHYPILITAESNGNYTPEDRYNEEKADWKLFRKETDISNKNINIDKNQQIDSIIQNYNQIVTDACNRAIPKSSRRNRPKTVPWWTAECTKANQQRKAALRKYQRSGLIYDKIEYCRKRAIAKNVQVNAKRDSWRKYVNSLNIFTPMSKIWTRIRKIKGKYTGISAPYLIKNNTHITDKKEIAELMADHYSKISNKDSYDINFQRKLPTIEHRINFKTKDNLSYNRPITQLEFKRMLATANKSAPGEDKITYNMISKAHPSCQNALLDIMNLILDTGIIPQQWLSSLTLSTPKPNKPPNIEENFRPISLTSCPGKLMEKIINTRLTYTLEYKNLIPKNQFGFRKMQGTIDALNRFYNDVDNALNRKEHTICVSFDLRKAYDTTWRYGILKVLYEMGFRGKLPAYIQSFLSTRSFKAKIGDVKSSPHSLEQGVPQGGVLSCTLFSLAINGILGIIPANISASLYVDDLLIYCSGSLVSSLERRIQNTINKINSWAKSHGFNFSAPKTNCIHFHRKKKRQPPLKLLLNGNIIPNRDTIKYLGMTFDYRLNWKEHIKNIKIECMKRLDLLKCISHTTWGSDRVVMLRLYRSIIRSKLDYGSFIYGSASAATLKTLDPVHNAAIRLCTGAYRSSPVASLYAESGEAPLQYRRNQLIMQYFARTQQLPSSAGFKYIDIDTYEEIEDDELNHTMRQIRSIQNKTGIKIETYPFKFPHIPPWYLKPDLICNHAEYPKKATCNDSIMKQIFYDHKNEFHRHQLQIYTDGAKSDEGVGCAAVSLGGRRRLKLAEESSIFTAEIYGLISAMKIILSNTMREFVVFSDARSAIQIVEHYDSTHPLITELTQHIIKIQGQNKNIKFCWCPSHVGIAGNEAADRDATMAVGCNLPVTSSQLPHRDWYPIIKKKIKNMWNNEWREVRGNKMREIKDNVSEWKSSIQRRRRDSIILTRLRIGHSKLTHQYLMEKREQPYCNDCIVPLTIKHVIAECPSYSDIRNRIFPETIDMSHNEKLKEILSEKANSTFNVENILNFLRQCNLYEEIV